MCRELDALRQSIVDYAKGFDAGSLIPAQAMVVVSACTQMEASISAVKALAASIVAEGNSWKDQGHRSAAEQLAAQTGTTTGRAKRVLDTGRRLQKQPEVSASARSGELSPDQTALVAEGGEANPAKAKELIEKAKRSSHGELLDEVARVKSDACDLEERRRQLHARRSLRFFRDTDGGFHTRVYGHPEDGATLHRVVSTIRRRLNLIAREQGRKEPIEALDYDALVTLADVALGHPGELDLSELLALGLFPQLDDGLLTRPAGPEPSSPVTEPPAPEPGPPDPHGSDPAPTPRGRRRKRLAAGAPKIIVRVDLETLLRGFPVEGELCEIVGYGQIPVSVIEELIANHHASVAAMLTRHHALVGVHHFGRRPNAHQKTALDFIYPTCAVRGCNQRAALQYDHRIDWAKTHFTVLDWMDRLCPHHHRLKTEKNWGLVPGIGKREFVPPDDPRNPFHHSSVVPGPLAAVGGSP